MRILTWNVNVLRTCLDYHPFSSLPKRNVEGLLEELGAEIACFQEHKTRRPLLDRQAACPGPYDAFYTFPRSKTGYSGVVTYVDSRAAVPGRAEEGITGLLLGDDKGSTMRPPWTEEERVGCYPAIGDMEWVQEEGGGEFDAARLDMEGRAVVCDFGLFVLFNLYCPNETNDARRPYKMNFLACLQERVRLLMAAGREVVIAGDINIMRAPIDSGEGGIQTSAAQHYEHPARVILNDWIAPRGVMVDVVRESWPDREGMFTCWNTKLDARPSNYGSRIDLILVSPGLRPWVIGGDILPKIHGSDHCPVYIDLHETITHPTRGTLHLREEMARVHRPAMPVPVFPVQEPTRTAPEPPRFATRFWDEFSGRQRTLKSFFGGGGAGARAVKAVKDVKTKGMVQGNGNREDEARRVKTEQSDTAPTTPTPPVAACPATAPTSSPTPPSTPFGIARAAFSGLDAKAGPSRSTPPARPALAPSRAPSGPEIDLTADDGPEPVPQPVRPAPRRSAGSGSGTGTGTGPSKSKAGKAGQQSISSFFVAPDAEDRSVRRKTSSSMPRTTAQREEGSQGDSVVGSMALPPPNTASLSPTAGAGIERDASPVRDSTPDPDPGPAPDPEADAALAAALAAEDELAESRRAAEREAQAPVWNSLFAKKVPPRCTVHGAPCRDYYSKVPGANKGKRFWLCSLPVGAGYDSGRSKRRREDVNPEFRCDFFLWDSANSRKEGVPPRPK